MGMNEDERPKRQLPQRATAGTACRRAKRHWTPEEDATLHKAVKCYKREGEDWKKIAKCVPNKTADERSRRWNIFLNTELIKGRWSREEDEILNQMIDKHGTSASMWSTISQAIPGRTSKQCQVRWRYGLNPAIKKDAWSQQEEITLIHAHKIYGDKWIKLEKFLPGRTDDAIKKHWKRIVLKKLDSYVASGLLEEYPFVFHDGDTSECIPTSTSITARQSGDSDDLRDSRSEDSSERNRPSSACATTPLSKLGLHKMGAVTNQSELKQNAHKLELKDSDPGHPERYNDHSVQGSQMIDGEMAPYKQPEHVGKGSPELSGAAELKALTRSLVDDGTNSSFLSKFTQDVPSEGPNVSARGLPKETAYECPCTGNNSVNPAVIKGRWSREEDEILKQMIDKHGTRTWSNIAQAIPGRTKIQCRDRWRYCLNPAVKKDAWSQQEEITLIHAHQIYGDKWVKLMKFLPGRTDDAIKKHWKHTMMKKLDSYLASGLLEEYPFASHDGDTSARQSGNTDDLKDSRSEDSSERNQPSPAGARTPPSNLGLHNIDAVTRRSELGQNAHKLELENSDSSHPERYNDRAVQRSQMMDGEMASYKQHEHVRKGSAVLAGSMELKAPMRTLGDGDTDSSFLSKFPQGVSSECPDVLARGLPNETAYECSHTGNNSINPALIKGRWSREEDEILKQMIDKHGTRMWSNIAQAIPGRTRIQCRDRWRYCLHNAVKKDAWSQREEITLIHAHQIYGDNWIKLTKFLRGRTDDEIKKHWQHIVMKKLDSYLASGLLEEYPFAAHDGDTSECIPTSATARQSGDTDDLKDSRSEDSSERNQPSSVCATTPLSKLGLHNIDLVTDQLELGQNAHRLELKDSDSSHPEKYNDHSVHGSQMIDDEMASYEQPEHVVKGSPVLSGSAELKAPTRSLVNGNTKFPRDVSSESPNVSARGLPNETAYECLHRQNNFLNPPLIKGRWSREEDKILNQMIDKHGTRWSTIAQAIPRRTKLQCRDRWRYLNSAIRKGVWSQQEEITLIHAHQIYGDKWIKLMKFLPGRTDDAIKRHWQHILTKKLDSYLASGLLEKYPFPVHDVDSSELVTAYATTLQSDDTDDLKDSRSEGSSARNQSSSAGATTWQSKPGLYNIDAATDELELGQNAHELELKDSDSSHPERYSDHVVQWSQVTDGQMASGKQHENVENGSPVLSCSAELAPTRSLDDGDTNSYFLSTFPKDVSSEGPNDFETSSGFDLCSFGLDGATAADLLDMPYCRSLMIVPPDSPCEGNSILCYY